MQEGSNSALSALFGMAEGVTQNRTCSRLVARDSNSSSRSKTSVLRRSEAQSVEPQQQVATCSMMMVEFHNSKE